MKIAFVDVISAFSAAKPESPMPVGGTATAECYLSRELTKQGHTCFLFNRISEPVFEAGVQALPLSFLADAVDDPSIDAFIFVGRWDAAMVRLVKSATKAKLVAWMHESSFNPTAVQPLDVFDGVVYVSDWQRRINQSFALPHWTQAVIRNGMNPLFAHLFKTRESIVQAKKNPPCLLFAGDFLRGAFHIPPILDELRKLTTDFTVEIYCERDFPSDPESAKKYIEWMSAQPNITHIGKVSQRELAQRMKEATLLLSPNTWPETCCIVLLEAMAAGLLCLTTNRAALTETAAGYATHVSIDDADDPKKFDMPVPYSEFAQKFFDLLKQNAISAPQDIEEKLQKQRQFFVDTYQWASRVDPWIDFLTTLKG